jgi:hypothetical protein
MSQTEAADCARAYRRGHWRLESYVPRGPIYDHLLDQFFFFRVVGASFYVGGDEVIAVRKIDA